MIPDGVSVLDVGCGAGGFLTYLLSSSVRTSRRAGPTSSMKAVETARRAGLDAFQADLTRERLSHRYDYVTCFETIEHIADAEAVAEALRDATQHRLIMSLPNFGYIHHRIRTGSSDGSRTRASSSTSRSTSGIGGSRTSSSGTAALGLRVIDVKGQYGGQYMPWQRYPNLFSPQLVYVLEPMTRPYSATIAEPRPPDSSAGPSVVYDPTASSSLSPTSRRKEHGAIQVLIGDVWVDWRELEGVAIGRAAGTAAVRRLAS